MLSVSIWSDSLFWKTVSSPISSFFSLVFFWTSPGGGLCFSTWPCWNFCWFFLSFCQTKFNAEMYAASFNKALDLREGFTNWKIFVVLISCFSHGMGVIFVIFSMFPNNFCYPRIQNIFFYSGIRNILVNKYICRILNQHNRLKLCKRSLYL